MDQNIVSKYKRSDHQIKLTIFLSKLYSLPLIVKPLYLHFTSFKIIINAFIQNEYHHRKEVQCSPPPAFYSDCGIGHFYWWGRFLWSLQHCPVIVRDNTWTQMSIVLLTSSPPLSRHPSPSVTRIIEDIRTVFGTEYQVHIVDDQSQILSMIYLISNSRQRKQLQRADKSSYHFIKSFSCLSR